MAGWRKAAWLSVLDRAGGGGGSTGGSLQAHLHSPWSAAASFLANYKRGGKCGNGHGSGKAVAGCFAATLALAFFYVSVTSGPAASDSFPSPAAAASSSSALLFSWLSSSNSSTTTSPRKSSGLEVGSGQATSAPGQTASARGRPLQDATAVGSDAERPAGNRSREEEPQVETATPMLQWRRTDGAGPSHNAAVGAPAQPAGNTDDVATGLDTGTSSREEIAKNAAAVDDVQNSARQAALPSSRQQRNDVRHRRRRAVRHRRRHPRRRKEIVVPAQDLVAENTDGDTAGVKTDMAVGPGNDMAAAGMNAGMGAVGAGNNRIVWTSGLQDLVSFAKCDVFNGRWVRDESYGFYPPMSCALIDDDFNCHKNGRQDSEFLKWRWQPHGCDIPRLNAAGFLERLRGQRIIFVGDSLNRNMWESLVCILRHGVRDKRSVYEASGKNQFKTRGYYSFRFRVHTFANYVHENS
ncbi:hypothetical protein U9M48_033144 [Paspalum notatum var. saurae]|uniref:Trichome birefringence-like N-terminal domain-containing protein n=1 Tax=Paspalum notatum var. saurae TaxID=547442 RepID=A0AAQ3U9E6_PASNO